ncbi:3-carboxy-cis,cis-muconate cycloisomerase [Caballeronia novacaledonica]|uniref:3-carboxy-cis,cis-muconate cycloisomerase n=1 Tax=Caballeronia novacaledonica TaxID=1544861 RepID=A0A2U3I8N7_9BURK|nr:3-carboxy-cis,cis-muconate cycloisomerase [Caballeronia novacaledonica]SPB16552.1 3-carboxy-cis,cis-muconate cycloisomerase [Caballeronia novacaledonica]
MFASTGRLTDLVCGHAAANEVWSPRATVQAMLDVEAALARVSALHGVIPPGAVEAIVAACDADNIDADALMTGAQAGGNLAIPLVKQLTAVVKANDAEAAKYVHWGATSQDIIDTGVVLQLRAALDLLDADLRVLSDALVVQAQAHQKTPMIGRTWLQQALPITLGLKFAQWLDAVTRHRQRLVELKARALALQFGGAAGTLASLRDKALPVAASLAEDLKLTLPALPWHTQRDRIAEAASFFGMLTGTLGKIARDISLMMQTEVGEVAEPAAAGKGGSSTMPHKRNPVGCAAVLTAATRAPNLVATIFAGMVQEHERALGGWQAEWEALPDLARLTAGALANIVGIVPAIEVNVERLARNLDVTNGLVLGEAVMLALGDAIGRLDAHKLVEGASKASVANGTSLFDELAANEILARHLSQDQLKLLLDPANYVGEAQAFVAAAIASAHSNKQEQ